MERIETYTRPVGFKGLIETPKGVIHWECWGSPTLLPDVMIVRPTVISRPETLALWRAGPAIIRECASCLGLLALDRTDFASDEAWGITDSEVEDSGALSLVSTRVEALCPDCWEDRATTAVLEGVKVDNAVCASRRGVGRRSSRWNIPGRPRRNITVHTHDRLEARVPRRTTEVVWPQWFDIASGCDTPSP